MILGAWRPCPQPAPARRLGCLAPTASRSWPPYLLSPGWAPAPECPQRRGQSHPCAALALELWGGGLWAREPRCCHLWAGVAAGKQGIRAFYLGHPPVGLEVHKLHTKATQRGRNSEQHTMRATTDTEALPVPRSTLTRGDSHPSRPACNGAARTRQMVTPVTQARSNRALNLDLVLTSALLKVGEKVESKHAGLILSECHHDSVVYFHSLFPQGHHLESVCFGIKVEAESAEVPPAAK